MSKPQIHSIWKVADIGEEQVSDRLIDFLVTQDPAYNAQMGDYNIHDPEAILAGADTDYEATPECKLIREELEAVQKVISKKGCSYFRIVG